jgi:hypothetical protein
MGVASMLSHSLIRVIESHAEQLTRGAVEKLQSSPRTESFHALSHDELYRRVYAVYHDLGSWLGEKTDHAIQAWYNELGGKRFREGVPLAEVLWALVLTKYHLRDYIGASGLADSAMELYRQQELHRLIGQFFDRALCYAAEGYEREASRPRQHDPSNASDCAKGGPRRPDTPGVSIPLV